MMHILQLIETRHQLRITSSSEVNILLLYCLRRLQHLTNTSRWEHITPILFFSLHWLTVRFRIDFKLVMFVFKATSFCWTCPGHDRGDRTFSVAASGLWNGRYHWHACSNPNSKQIYSEWFLIPSGALTLILSVFYAWSCFYTVCF